MGPKETLHAGRVNVVLVIRVPVVVAVHRRPPERAALDCCEAEQREKKLGRTRRVVGAVAAPSCPNDPEAAEMQDDKRNRPRELEAFGQFPHFLSADGKIVRVDGVDERRE